MTAVAAVTAAVTVSRSKQFKLDQISKRKQNTHFSYDICVKIQFRSLSMMQITNKFKQIDIIADHFTLIKLQ